VIRYAVKGVFCIASRKARQRRIERIYEERVLLVEARSEQAARKKAHTTFARDQWTAANPVPDVAQVRQTYEGIARLIELGTVTDPGEVWYEYVDGRPRLEERAPKRR